MIPSADLLEMIAYAMDRSDLESPWFLDLVDEEVVSYDAEFDDPAFVQMIEEDVAEERFVHIPTRSSREGWEQMEQFIQTLDDNTTHMVLLTAINGPGAFGRFKDAVYQLELSEGWFDFKNRLDAQAALKWLHDRGLIRKEDIKQGLLLHDDLLAQRKQREVDLTNMTAGKRIRCTYTLGHAGQLTLDQTYEVLAERKDERLVRLIDDRGKVVWLPKTHFDLI
jgi:hypothetical protein